MGLILLIRTYRRLSGHIHVILDWPTGTIVGTCYCIGLLELDGYMM